MPLDGFLVHCFALSFAINSHNTLEVTINLHTSSTEDKTIFQEKIKFLTLLPLKVQAFCPSQRVWVHHTLCSSLGTLESLFSSSSSFCIIASCHMIFVQVHAYITNWGFRKDSCCSFQFDHSFTGASKYTPASGSSIIAQLRYTKSKSSRELPQPVTP